MAVIKWGMRCCVSCGSIMAPRGESGWVVNKAGEWNCARCHVAEKPQRQIPGWDTYFLNIAEVVSQRSKDPDTQVGAVLVDSQHRIISTGYNGPPAGIDDGKLDWTRPAKYAFVLHAEINALLYSGARGDLQGATLYVTGVPCVSCLKAIMAAGLRRVVYRPKTIVSVDIAESMQLAKLGGVEILKEGEATP